MFALLGALAALVAVILSEAEPVDDFLGLSYGGWLALAVLFVAAHMLVDWRPWPRQ